MAPGDLNLKKSWHPGLMKNRKKVWEVEQEALNERKKIEERQEEIRQERELAELRALQYDKTGQKPVERLDWMYESNGLEQTGKLKSNEADDYLLGKKRLDELIVKNKAEPKKHGFEKIQLSSLISQQDEMSKLRDDPMVKIRQQQIRKAQELKEKKQRDERSRSDSRSHRHHHTSHRHDHRERSSHGSSRDFEKDPSRRHHEVRDSHHKRETNEGSTDRSTSRRAGGQQRDRDTRIDSSSSSSGRRRDDHQDTGSRRYRDRDDVHSRHSKSHGRDEYHSSRGSRDDQSRLREMIPNSNDLNEKR